MTDTVLHGSPRYTAKGGTAAADAMPMATASAAELAGASGATGSPGFVEDTTPEPLHVQLGLEDRAH